MLMRYADHLAHGHGITWNVGEKPVDGATDFLFMCLLAGLVKLGLAVDHATRLVVVGSHLATVALLYGAARTLHRLAPSLALVPALYLAAGPATSYIDAYFGTPFFAFLATLTWCLALLAARRPASRLTAAAFSLSGLMLALTRPEGIFLTVLMLAALIYHQGMRQSRTVLATLVMTFLILGMVYFVWRWQYFGHPLPNPFYKKGGGRLHEGSLIHATLNMVRLAYPVLILLAIALGAQRARREAIFGLIPLAGFTAIWVLLSDEMNYSMRFQYPVLPVALLAWPPALLAVREVMRPPTWSGFAREQQVMLRWAAAVAVIGLLSTQLMLYRSTGSTRDGRYTVALALKRYESRSYTIATTEAGILPLYSGWRAVDTWGLNDQWIAHNGRITPDYLQRYRPEVIVAHGSLLESGRMALGPSWDRMVRTLRRYAEENHYQLAAAYGETPYDVHFYYVATGFADGEEITRQIRSLDYPWYTTGRPAINYASLPGLTTASSQRP
jgi:hypothetical protein